MVGPHHDQAKRVLVRCPPIGAAHWMRYELEGPPWMDWVR